MALALDGFNAAAAALILNKPEVTPATRTQGVALAAIARGAVGLAVPFVLARNAKTDTGGIAPGREGVPDVVGEQVHDAIELLMAKELDGHRPTINRRGKRRIRLQAESKGG
jgi:hypothetical protein